MGNIKTKYNKLTKETTHYTFDARNRLVKYVKTDENNQTVKRLEFTYDAFGRRVSKTEDGITQKYLYDANTIIAILDEQNNIIATITHGESIDTPLSITNQNGTFYYHRDHQGSIIALTDESGNVVESFTYDNHYGAIIDHTKTLKTNNPYAYTGREYDTPELYYYRARYYDPTIQRFISEDPIGYASGDYNFYRYVFNDPVGLVDPSGENPLLIIPLPLILLDTYLNAPENENDIYEGPTPENELGLCLIGGSSSRLFNFYGPHKGRVFQVSYKKRPIFRLDYHGYRKIDPSNKPILHYHRYPDMKKHRPYEGW